MINDSSLDKIRIIKERKDSNSEVILFRNSETKQKYVQKRIYGVDIPIFRALFSREVEALRILNRYDCFAKIITYQSKAKINRTNEILGVIYMEYIEGEDLGKYNVSSLNISDKVYILNQILNALECAHSYNIIHRDLNPSNIMIDSNLKVTLIDFGTCKIKNLTSEGTTFNYATNLYSAPEVSISKENATESSDLYSIGAILYYLFTFKQPKPANSFSQYIEENGAKLGVDFELLMIIKKLVSFNEKDRYQSVDNLMVDLKPVLLRFANSQKKYYIYYPSSILRKLKKRMLVPEHVDIYKAEEYFETNFVNPYVFLKKEGNNLVYCFLGNYFELFCSYDINDNLFHAFDIKKINLDERENRRSYYLEKNETIIFKSYSSKLRCDNNDLVVEMDDYMHYFNSKENTDRVFSDEFGEWINMLKLMRDGVKDNALRIKYSGYEFKKNRIIEFTLSDDEYFDTDKIDMNIEFIQEREGKKSVSVGYFVNEIQRNKTLIIQLRYDRKKPKIQSSGELCENYQKNLTNIHRQINAFEKFKDEEYSSEYNLKRIFTGYDKPTTKPIPDNFRFINKNLDPYQQEAVKKSLNSQSISIIQGPPGTGKTQVIVEIVKQIEKRNRLDVDIKPSKVLLVSQSHTAVDQMLEEFLGGEQISNNIVRIGREENIKNDVSEKFGVKVLEEQWKNDVIFKSEIAISEVCKEHNIKYDDFITSYNDEISGSLSLDNMKGSIYSLLKIHKNWVDNIGRSVEVEYYKLKNSSIIAGTCTGFISNRIIRELTFDYVIVDEAAKATFTELIISLNKAKKIILVGDHKQLPPILDNDVIKNNKDSINLAKLNHGLFEKMIEEFPDSNKTILSMQYRMHPTIGTLISEMFYDRIIQNGVFNEDRVIDIPSYQNTAIEWVSTSLNKKSERSEEIIGSSVKSYRNNLEASIILNRLKYIDSHINRSCSVAVITGYSAQKEAIKNRVKAVSFNHLNVEVDTVDAFQGSQKEIIIYSTVRSNNSPRNIGFLKSNNRLNVAFSRAKSLLIIVGDLDFLNNSYAVESKFPDVIRYIKNEKNCRVVDWEDYKNE